MYDQRKNSGHRETIATTARRAVDAFPLSDFRTERREW